MNVHGVMGIFWCIIPSMMILLRSTLRLTTHRFTYLYTCIYHTIWCFVLFNVRQPQYGWFKPTRIACVKRKFKDDFTFAREKNAKREEEEQTRKERLRRAIVGRERWANTLNSFIKCDVRDAIRYDVRFLSGADDMIYWIATVARALAFSINE